VHETLTDIEALPVSAVILDSSGTIVGVNEVWKDFGRRNGLGLPNSGVGFSYLAHCGSGGSGPSVASDLGDLLAGRRDLVTHVYPCDSPGENRWFMLLAFPLALSRPSGIAILHTNISSLIPLPVVDGQKRGRRTVAEQGAQLPALVDMTASVEASVSEALSSQLRAMLAFPEKRPSEAKAVSEAPNEAPHAQLSKRQMEVLRLLGEGKTNREIAKLLYRSPHTIKLHVSAILRELNVKSRTQAALLASKLPTQRRA
jgi:DNA-binding CsgD family transcriptional regulator